MITELEFEEWCNTLRLPPAGEALVRSIRGAEPARRVQGRRSNSVVRYPSKKMACIVQAESHTVELPLVYILEHSSKVLEFYDQPCQIRLKYRTAEGHAGGFLHVPDFFVIYTDKAGFFECKPGAAMDNLANDMPWRFQRNAEGRWTCPPGEDFANPLGLSYHIWTPEEVSPVLIRNLKFLEDYLRPIE